MEVVSFLNEMYTKIDKALENHKVYKVINKKIKQMNCLSLYFIFINLGRNNW